MLSVTNVHKTYRQSGLKKNRTGDVKALQGINLTIEPGQIMGILGPNGAGKTTLIKIICGLILPDTGNVEIAGVDVTCKRNQAMRYIGAVLEGNRNLYWRLTVRENLRYFGMIKGKRGADLTNRINELIETFDLTDKQNQIAAHLSRGMQQRLAIMAALVADPRLLLLDEPTLGLDVESSRGVRDVICQISDLGTSILLSTHQIPLAEELCSHVSVINRGHVLHSDVTENVFRIDRELYVIEFDGTTEQIDELVAELTQAGLSFDLDTTRGRHTLKVQSVSPTSIYEAVSALSACDLRLLQVKTGDADLEERYVWLVRGEASL